MTVIGPKILDLHTNEEFLSLLALHTLLSVICNDNAACHSPGLVLGFILLIYWRLGLLGVDHMWNPAGLCGHSICKSSHQTHLGVWPYSYSIRYPRSLGPCSSCTARAQLVTSCICGRWTRWTHREEKPVLKEDCAAACNAADSNLSCAAWAIMLQPQLLMHFSVCCDAAGIELCGQ